LALFIDFAELYKFSSNSSYHKELIYGHRIWETKIKLGKIKKIKKQKILRVRREWRSFLFVASINDGIATPVTLGEIIFFGFFTIFRFFLFK